MIIIIIIDTFNTIIVTPNRTASRLRDIVDGYIIIRYIYLLRANYF